MPVYDQKPIEGHPGCYSLVTADGRTHKTMNPRGFPHSIDDNPAVFTTDGKKVWYKNGKIHRTSGPAILNKDGSGEVWLEGKLLFKVPA